MSLQQQQRVNFDEAVKIYLVPIHTEFSQEERDALWLGRTDFDVIQAGIRRTVKAIRRQKRHSSRTVGHNDDEEESVCDRGLEHLRSAAHMEQRKINKDCCVSAVFGEQKRQRSLKCYDDVALAEASMDGSQWARQKAQEEGMRDAAAVRELRKREVCRYQPDAAAMEMMEQAIKLCAMPVPSSGSNAHQSSSQNQADLFEDKEAVSQMLANFQGFKKSTRIRTKKQDGNQINSPHLMTPFSKRTGQITAHTSSHMKHRNVTTANSQRKAMLNP
uniref:Uncharacterized protein n=1 Tax=Odontella aurita TaxID=265563 RepID=A0A7S4NH43_9STRA|mmetsp:Transcript_716/g.2116  ORF Transcript_716/g.2116 Transcript_716/m.2116 type:complete len:274 (+) Transcript_716:52-873(+)